MWPCCATTCGSGPSWCAKAPAPSSTGRRRSLQRNVKLPEVLNDITSLTGRKILQAILAGERDPLTLARLRDRRCRHSADAIARALRGNWREEALFALQQAWDSWQHYQKQLRALEEVIHKQLQRMKKSGDLPPLAPKPRQRGRKPNDPRFDVRTALYYVSGVDLTELEGIAEVTALVVVSAIGLDRSRFPSVRHFCAWLGLCPLVRQSGRNQKGQKKVQSSRTRRGRGRAAQALCLAASGLWQNQSARGGFLRRLKARLGPEKAVVATAPKLARVLYQTLRSGVLSATVSAAAQHTRAVEALKKKARRLGLVVTEAAAPAPAGPPS
jgi:transposase